MTKKDYIKIAEVLRQAHGLEDGMQTWNRIINGLTRIMIDDNPRFNLRRFEAAATGEKE
jgi:hypothetical protein